MVITIHKVSFDLINLAIDKIKNVKERNLTQAIDHPNVLNYLPLHSGGEILTESSLKKINELNIDFLMIF